jgi:hypothetical protein
LAEHGITLLSNIRAQLQDCGYSGNLLETDYTYEDREGAHTVQLAGFSSEIHDLRTSCISVLCGENTQEVSEEVVYSYRGIGTPVVFVCEQSAIQWWEIRTTGAVYKETISGKKISGFFKKYKAKLAPQRIARAKNLARVDTKQQLEFVDCGLTPLLEHEIGERLGGLMNRVLGLLRDGFTEKQLEKAETQRWLFRAGFWLLCAKILKDKGVKSFKRLNLNDIDKVIYTVSKHYRAREPVEIRTRNQRSAIERASEEINKFSSLKNLTTEAFGYLYENVLVDKDLRAALGIHATPTYLVNYIVWQLWPWIQKIPEDKRIVLEPACGHAPFLTGAIRVLREFFEGDTGEFHKYAKKNLIGMEVDPFAREIGRLSLTLADVPNPNGWKIEKTDIYRNDILSEQAAKSMILLSNPPFEDFSPDEQKGYNEEGKQLQSYNKAAEMLWRTLPFMPEGSVFGIVLPRGFLKAANLTDLREMILSNFELHQICCLPKKGVFLKATHEAVILFGFKKIKRLQRKGVRENKVLYRHISQEGLDRFKETYEGRDEHVLQSKFCASATYDLRLRELDGVWNYCERNFPQLESMAGGGQGLIYKGRDLPQGAKTFDEKRFAGAVKGFFSFDRNILLHGLPKEYWMSLNPKVIRRPQWGLETGTPQIIMNYAPVSAGHWRLKALIDREGRPVGSRFLAFRPKSRDWSLDVLWGILNSPLANAFIYAHTTDRDIPAGVVRSIPIPACTKESLKTLEQLVGDYFEWINKLDLEAGINVQQRAKELLLSIDAEVMRLYDLPPRYEKKILDLFQGEKRKGVDFDFKGYYPEGFESAIPLHVYLSQEYQKSTFENVNKWVDENRSDEIVKAFEVAVDAFGDE